MLGAELTLGKPEYGGIVAYNAKYYFDDCSASSSFLVATGVKV